MSTMYSEFANAVVLYQSTIANANADTGDYYLLQGWVGSNSNEGFSNPNDIELFDDCVKTTIWDSNGNVSFYQWYPFNDTFTFMLNPPGSSGTGQP